MKIVKKTRQLKCRLFWMTLLTLISIALSTVVLMCQFNFQHSPIWVQFYSTLINYNRSQFKIAKIIPSTNMNSGTKKKIRQNNAMQSDFLTISSTRKELILLLIDFYIIFRKFCLIYSLNLIKCTLQTFLTGTMSKCYICVCNYSIGLGFFQTG